MWKCREGEDKRRKLGEKNKYILEEAGERKLTFSHGLGQRMFRIHIQLSMAFLVCKLFWFAQYNCEEPVLFVVLSCINHLSAVPYSIHRINVLAFRILSNVSASVAISDCIYSEQQSQTSIGNQILPLHNQESLLSRKSIQHAFRRTALRPASEIFVRSVQ
jgi:hypothetical protein